MEDINNIYFNLLKQNLGTKKEVISLFCADTNPRGNAIPYSLAEESQLPDFNVVDYSQIKNEKKSSEKKI